jgi:two-component system nitrogen regulation response regulator GlnG
MNGQNLRVWLVDDDASIRWVLERALRNGGMAPRAFEAAEPALDALRRESPDVLITDIRMPGQSGLELLKKIRDTRPALPVIVMTAHSDLGSAVSAYEGGAFEYLPKPFDIDQAVALVKRAANASAVVNGDGTGTPRIPELLGRAPAMQQVFRAIGRLARSSVTVLITGESGTGKELVARALHDHSPRAGKPFIALNTSAIPGDLLESELFGHENGAFTGADSQRRGRFEQSDGGTLFLDEIGELSLPVQSKLLAMLENRAVVRVGSTVETPIDVRVIAATHRSLQKEVAEGRFREDLYYRISVVVIRVPPLRERPSEILLIAKLFADRYGARHQWHEPVIASDASAALVAHSWPGNIRELRNAIEHAMLLTEDGTIRREHLPETVTGTVAVQQPRAAGPKVGGVRAALAEVERASIEEALHAEGGNRTRAALQLGKISDSGLERRRPRGHRLRAFVAISPCSLREANTTSRLPVCWRDSGMA